MENRHLERYKKLISYFKNNPTEGFVERHHIIPKCMGGKDDASNIILLPPRAHYLAHYFLHKAYINNRKLAHAFAMMAINNQYQNRCLNGKLYEMSRIARSNALKGRKHTKETIEKMKKPKSEEHRKKMLGNQNGKGNKGKKCKPRTEEHTQKLVESQRHYHINRTKKFKERCEYYKNLFKDSGLSKRAFAKKENIPYPTMKGYLRL